MWQARFYQSLPKLVTEHPKARWLFLTLTVRNCPITELGETLTAMNAAWQRLKDRKEFRPVLGWVRTTEVTRGKDGSERGDAGQCDGRRGAQQLRAPALAVRRR